MESDQDKPSNTEENTELSIDELSAEVDALDGVEEALKKSDKDEIKEAIQSNQNINDNDALAMLGHATINVSRTEKPHSFSWRYGGAGTDSKVYYETPEQLREHFENMAEAQESIAQSIRRIKDAHTEDKQ